MFQNRKLGQYKNVKKNILLLGICIFIALCCCTLCKFMQHEYKQNETINQLNAQVALLSSELKGITENVEFPNDTYNYLAIGNSITFHDTCDYWWNKCGMAASKESEDYFHKLCGMLEDKYGSTTAYAYNFSVWEIMENDRAETLPLLDTYLNENLDLITV